MVHVSNIIIKGKSYKMLQGLADYAIFLFFQYHFISFHIFFNYKARDNTNKKSQFTM